MSAGDKGLKFKLGLSTLEAKKEVKDFVKFANAEGKKLNIGLGAGKSGGARSAVVAQIREARKEAESLGRMLAKAQSEVDRVSAKGGASLTGQVKRVEADIKRAFAALSSGGMSERNFRRIVNERIEALREYARAQVQLDREIKQANQRQEAEAKRAADRVIKNEEDRARALNRIRVNAAAEMQKIEISRGVTDLATRKRFEQQIQDVMQNSAGQQVEDVKIAVALMMAEYRKLSLVSVQGQRMGDNGDAAKQNAMSKRMSRNVQLLFNMQQAVEDFSFAGFRGISNNLAFMASGLGGPGGIITLLGVMALTLPDAARQMGFFADETESANDQIAEQIGLVRSLAKQRIADSDRANREGVKGFEDPRKFREEQAADKKKVDSLVGDRADVQSDLDALMRLGQLTEKIAAARTALDNATASGGSGGDKGSAERQQRWLKEIAALEKERDRTARGLANKRPEYGSGEELIWDSQEYAKALRTEISGVNGEIKETEQSIADTEKRWKDFGEQGVASVKAFNDVEAGQFSVPDLGEQAESVENLREAWKNFFDEKQERSKEFWDESKKNAEHEANMVLMGGDPAKAKKILDDWVTAHKETATQSEKIAGQWKDVADGYGRAHFQADKLLDVTEDMARNAEKHLETLKEQIKELEKASTKSKHSFESSVFGVQQGIVDKQAKKETERRKTADEKFVEQQFSPALQEAKRRKALGIKGGPTESDIKARMREVIEQRGGMIEDMVERDRAAKQHAMLGKRGGVLKSRADGQEKAGDFEEARGSMEEAQSLLMDAAGSAEDPAQAEFYLKRAAAVQAEIERIYAAEAESKKKEAEETQKSLDAIKEMKKTMESIKTTAESIDLFKDGSLEKADAMNAKLQEMFRNLTAINATGDVGKAIGAGVELPGVGGAPGVPQAGIHVPQPVQVAMAGGGGTTVNNTRSNSSSVTNNFNVGQVVASGNSGRSITRDLGREAKARNIRVA